MDSLPRPGLGDRRTYRGPACPCSSGRALIDCCGRYIGTAIAAPDAVSLMRSRYTAFTLRNDAYLLATWHPSVRPDALALPENQKWLGLDVRAHAVDSNNPDRATVEFVARSRINGRAIRLHEVSSFVREAGRWYYLAGIERPAKPAKRG
ncbi:MAG: YchJ family protein [Burkholderiales bacterium]